VKELMMLPVGEWFCELQRGDPVLEIHIPEGSRMEHEQCRDSLEYATRYYHERFPDKPFRGFVCTSWLFDSQLQSILSPTSNIVKFQKDFYLFPVVSDERETYNRVFGTTTLDPGTASRDTSLRRAIIEYAEAGHRLHGGGGIRLNDQ
jgi:hypothetical protein